MTLNYGLRYEYYTPLHEADDLHVLFDIDTGSSSRRHQRFYTVEDEQLPAARRG